MTYRPETWGEHYQHLWEQISPYVLWGIAVYGVQSDVRISYVICKALARLDSTNTLEDTLRTLDAAYASIEKMHFIFPPFKSIALYGLGRMQKRARERIE